MEHVLRNRAQCGDVQQQQKADADKTEAASPQASFL
jgi:chorismate synthase